ncbi:MAG: hypothetical protein CVV44_13585 [Spirochaetae bacterium HGW-Spirochaetae-1]|jgi:AcrR family transcriptional regulator|nr:MAG: hypothetical protein CVV44_13585 [Spirochaetae bacterium HGW-Spirochaetae-1]
MEIEDRITISELARITGIPASTIRFYLREGLITPPVKQSRTRAYYNNDNIMELKRLRKLRDEDGLSIEEIRKIARYPGAVKEKGVTNESSQPDRRSDILDSAIELFRSKGYDAININDIAEKAGISKGTFYKHFRDKENLFYECADKVFLDIDREFRELLDEKNIVKRLELRTSLFIRTHHYMIDMLHIMRGSSTGANSENSVRLNRIIDNLINPIASDLKEGIKQGIFRDMDTTIVAHLLMGAAEYGIYFCEGKNNEEIDQLVEKGLRLIMQGAIRTPLNSETVGLV